MDLLLILKYVAAAFGSTLIILAAYYLTKHIGITVLGTGQIHDNLPLLFIEIASSAFVASVWLCSIASWNEVAILFLIILIPALIGLWRAVDIKKRKGVINK